MTSKNILLVDKPKGITSFGVIRRLRRELGIKKMGHAGTLDPAATGLMIIGVGEGTKELTDYIKLDKEYEAEILIGIKTDSGDMDGVVVEEKDIEEPLSEEKVSAALQSLVGTLTLPVSAYSAIKKDGVPMYKKAYAAKRQGQTVTDIELPVREMKVHGATLIATTYDIENKKVIIKVRFHVGSGTYIRSLAEELGHRLGNYPATLQNLRRTKIADFKVEDARKVEK